MRYEQFPQYSPNIKETKSGKGEVEKKETEEKSDFVPETRELPFSVPNKIVFCNLSKSPKRVIDEDKRKELEQVVDLDYIKEKARNWENYLVEKIQNNDVVLLGEMHSSQMVERDEITNFLETAKENSVTHIGLEIEEYYQEAFDKFIETGKFADEDNPKDYEKVFEYLSLLKEKDRKLDRESSKKLRNFEKGLYKNFLFWHDLQQFYPILKKLRESNMRAVCLDSNHRARTNPKMYEEFTKARKEGKLKEYYRAVQLERDSTMFENAKKVFSKGKKMLVLMGALHTACGDREDKEYKSLGSRLAEDEDICSFTINLDRDLERDSTNLKIKRELPNKSLNSVLFTAMEKQKDWQGRRFGVDLNENVLRGKEYKVEKFPFDGYIKL